MGSIVDDDFGNFLRHPDLGVEAWKRHVEGWLEFASLRQRIHLLRYEDLLVDPSACLKKLFANFGWHCDDAALADAISLASVDNMKMQEEMFRAHYPRYRFTFVAGGSSGKLPEFDEAIINATRDLRTLLGYDS